MTVPAVLVVPGAWHKPEHFGLLVDELPDADVHIVTLTSSGDDPAALRDMYADADAIARAATAIDGPVIVVAHSYGGVPTTQAFGAAGAARGVVRIIYVAAFLLDIGESLVSAQGGSLMPWSRRRRRPGIGDYLEVITPMEVFYHDVDEGTARDAISRLGYQSFASMSQPLTATAWREVPSTYVVCDADRAMPVAAQEAMARRADDTARLPTSHSPFLSHPAALAGVIRRSLETTEVQWRDDQ